MKKFFDDFKAFISKGNVVDLTVAVVIGAAFKAIISSLVDNVIMPPIGLILGGVKFSQLKFVIQKATIDGTPEVAIGYGIFIQRVVDFLIIGLCVFLVVKSYTRMQDLITKKEETLTEEAAPPEPSAEEKLLSEIRDILKENKSKELETSS